MHAKTRTRWHTRRPAGPLSPHLQVGTISSPALATNFFRLYLGSDPVSADAKRSFGQGLADLLAE